jgi:hypothetical protein
MLRDVPRFASGPAPELLTGPINTVTGYLMQGGVAEPLLARDIATLLVLK